ALRAHRLNRVVSRLHTGYPFLLAKLLSVASIHKCGKPRRKVSGAEEKLNGESWRSWLHRIHMYQCACEMFTKCDKLSLPWDRYGPMGKNRARVSHCTRSQR